VSGVLIWFLVAAPFLVAEIFRSPMVDYRLVALGAVLPVAEVAAGRPFVLHTLAAPVVVMTLTMVATTGRRLLRRRLLGISIGLFLHLVLDGTWSSAHLFWWPVFGFSFAGLDVPESSSPGLRLLLELAGLVLAFVAWRRYGLDDRSARERLVRSGHLPAAVRVGGMR
jgi:hypothetical protein